MTAKFTDAPCSRCGAPNRVVNPRWLRERRVDAGITLRDMAKRLKLSAPYLSDVELGRRTALPYLVTAYEAL